MEETEAVEEVASTIRAAVEATETTMRNLSKAVCLFACQKRVCQNNKK